VFQFVPIASCPISGYHWEEPGSLFFTHSHQTFIYIDKIPLSFLFSRLNRIQRNKPGIGITLSQTLRPPGGLKPALKVGEDLTTWKNPKLMAMCLTVINTQLTFYRIITPVRTSTNGLSKAVILFLECAF